MRGDSGSQNIAPAGAPRQDGHLDLVIPDGPWNQNVWTVLATTERKMRTRGQCCVPECDRSSRIEVPLCVAHYMQWIRDGKPSDQRTWAMSAARPLQRRAAMAPRRTEGLTVDFGALPHVLTTEIRYVVGTKFVRGEWTANENFGAFLQALLNIAVRTGVDSVLERSVEQWHMLLRRHFDLPEERYQRAYGGYLRTFYSTLSRALIADPWAENIWLWKGVFANILGDTNSAATSGNLRWDDVETPWLRSGTMALAKNKLLAGQRKWSTISSWVKAVCLLDTYLVQDGLTEPNMLDREAFLDFLSWVRESKRSTKHNLGLVSTAASILESLRADGIVPELGSPVYLRRGENVLVKVRAPRPYPPDVVQMIDEKIIPDPELGETERLMLRFARWAGPRISELVVMPIDVLRRNASGGYWVEYFMSKTDSWRRFPVPDSLGMAIRDQQDRVRAEFGDAAEILFPRSTAKRRATYAAPWSSSGFRTFVRTLFIKHKIIYSTVTGEAISGGAVHRFRHTIGTALLNNNWSQPEVQEFLGHLTGTMTSHYAMITDDTLARKAAEFHESQNREAAQRRLEPSVERLREKFSVVLPNGACTLPSNLSCDFRPNPCLDCTFFRPEGDGVEENNSSHRRRLKLLVDEARAAGDEKVIALNQPMLERLDQILGPDEQDGNASA